MSTIGRFTTLVLGFIVLSAVFGVIERRPARPSRGWTAPSVGTDVVFWFFTPVVTRTVSTLFLAAVLIGVARAIGLHVSVSQLQNLFVARGPIARQARWIQGLEALVLADGLGYAMHRVFHGRPLWPFHAVHHSSEHVDWLSSVRLHPVNEALMRVGQIVPLIALGFDPRVLAATVPVFTLYALLLHANVTWRFGPLGYVVASPAFHRWHHAADAAAVNKNFAGLFPFWDLVFGTFYLPATPPERFGLPDARLPDSLWALLWAPFKSEKLEVKS